MTTPIHPPGQPQFGCTVDDLGDLMTDAEFGLAILRNCTEWEAQWWTQQDTIAPREWCSFDIGVLPLDEAMRYLELFQAEYPCIPFRLLHVPTQKARTWMRPEAIVDTAEEREYVRP